MMFNMTGAKIALFLVMSSSYYKRVVYTQHSLFHYESEGINEALIIERPSRRA